jgi:hypothetical protein
LIDTRAIAEIESVPAAGDDQTAALDGFTGLV